MSLRSLHPQWFALNLNHLHLIQASVVADAFEIHAPGAMLLDGRTVVAAGRPESIGQPMGATVTRYPGHLVCPAFINAHSHLDLSDLGGIEERAFAPWLSQVIRHRQAQRAPGAVEKAVSIGIAQSIRGGTLAVGDICGSERAFDAVSGSNLKGVAFLEILGHGVKSDEAIKHLQRWLADVSLRHGSEVFGPVPGLSPHAPYSTSTDLYAFAQSSGVPVATHLAESLEELEWCGQKSGIFAELVSRMGAKPRPGPADGLHPLDGFLQYLPKPGGLAVHLNYLEPRHVSLLKASGATVVYCPRASAFFGHPHGGAPGHAWREMLVAGIPVALGTDGRPCLAADGAAAERLSILDEILHLQRTGGVTLEEWLPMATLHGAGPLGVPETLVSFMPGATPGILALKLASQDTRLLDETAGIQWISSEPNGTEAD